MSNTLLMDNAKVMAKGQITIPKEFRNKLGLRSGDRVTFIYQNGRIFMMNAATSAMRMLQLDMADAESASDDEVQSWVDAVR